MTPEARIVADRIAANDARRDRMRQRWADDAGRRSPPPPAPILPRVVIPLGPGAQLAIRNRVTLTFGPLVITMPRLEQARISEAVLRLQSSARAWPDGTMRGIKRLIWRDGSWVSPSRGTVWKEGRTSAVDFDEAGELRGEAGIHAVWPDKLKELNEYSGKLVEVAGWGRCTVADLGWRAEHAAVVRELL